MVEGLPMRSQTFVLHAVVALQAALGLLAVAPAVQAQSARSGGGANAQLMQQMQQLASERTSLQAENAKLKKDLEDLRKERDTLENGQQALDKKAKASEAALRQIPASSRSNQPIARRQGCPSQIPRAGSASAPLRCFPRARRRRL